MIVIQCHHPNDEGFVQEWIIFEQHEILMISKVWKMDK